LSSKTRVVPAELVVTDDDLVTDRQLMFDAPAYQSASPTIHVERDLSANLISFSPELSLELEEDIKLRNVKLPNYLLFTEDKE